jgi:hypothetical protein
MFILAMPPLLKTSRKNQRDIDAFLVLVARDSALLLVRVRIGGRDPSLPDENSPRLNIPRHRLEDERVRGRPLVLSLSPGAASGLTWTAAATPGVRRHLPETARRVEGERDSTTCA